MMHFISVQATVVGLGYVGLPLAVALARTGPVTGLDIDARRVSELKAGFDRTAEVDAERIGASTISFQDDPAQCLPSEFYVVTVPTPVGTADQPDLSILEAASRAVGEMLPGAINAGLKPIVVFESTVYPGVTEDICGPILEQASGAVCGVDFFLGYSPERINPGDREHTVDRIQKVVAGQTPEVLERVAQLYGSITSGGIFRAKSIKTAEAAKVIENAQRDINIAFMNEIAQVFARSGISIWDVLEAARSKWNFLPFTPGLVGGHCIGVDPFYLAYHARSLGHLPRVILAGRSVNDDMARHVADALHDRRGAKAGSALVLGVTFKENVPDIRNSKVADLVARLAWLGHEVSVHDPLADADEVAREYGFCLLPEIPARTYDLVLLAVPHQEYLARGGDALRSRVASGGTLADLKGVLDRADWTL